MKCKHCGFEIKENEKFCTNCGKAISQMEKEGFSEDTKEKENFETNDLNETGAVEFDEKVQKNSDESMIDTSNNPMKKVLLYSSLSILCIFVLAVAISAFVSHSGKNRDTYSPNDYNVETEITVPDTTIEESTTQKINEFEKIGSETLQYPATNDIFTYDVYETYVEITGSVEKDLTGELVIPETLDNLPVRSISSRAFGGPGEAFTIPGYSITSLVLSDNLYKISEDAFYRCVNLSSISFGKNIQFIGSAAFAHTAIKSVVIPDSVIEIGESVFLECKSLKSVKLGKMMTEIPESMFNSCYSLNEIEWVGNIVSIGQSAFRNTAFSNIDIPKTVTTIERWVFADMPNLIEFIFPDSVTEISDYVFEDCESLEKVTIGNGINKLPAYLFQDCANLNTLIIPGNVGEIDSRIIDVGLGGQSNPTIYGEAGTAAARFASSKGLTFKLLET